MSDSRLIIKKQVIPVIPLRGMLVFPFMLMHFDVVRTKSLLALEEAMAHNQLIFLVAQRDPKVEEPEPEDFYPVGTIARIKQMLKLPGDSVRVLVEGVSRASISKFFTDQPYFSCEVMEKEYEGYDIEPVESEALKRKAVETFQEYFQLVGKLSNETLASVTSIEDAGQLSDVIAASIVANLEAKQDILSEFDVNKRLIIVISILSKEINILLVERKINSMVKSQIDKNQRDYFLREQMKAIQTELGDDGLTAEIAEYRKAFHKCGLPKDVMEKMEKELSRMAKLPSGSSESAVVRSYLDLILELPWNKSTKENADLERARKILDNDHYGLEKVKERILEFLAVRQLSQELHGPILCLVGPPGVGKTSIAKSVAHALNRKYVRMSLGGVRDEAEIRGHRKTYIGAMPGRIINALRQAGSNNAMILLDEIDKMSNDFRGDPASAMLEVLDAEQNNTFRDHYVEVPFDLSHIMFLTTANSLDTVPAPLLDRMEVIEISGYTEQEKGKIAEKYLIPKQRKVHGLTAKNLSFEKRAVSDIINYYTRESGVRNLERQISRICRRVAKQIVGNEKKSVKVTSKNLESYLGVKKYRYDTIKEKNEVGVATGLAWTAVGGVTLAVEVNVMDGSGKLELTGHLGEVMQESARAAMSYIRSRAKELGIEREFYKTKDIQIHVPEGATPKDGPSAGITIATALISALSNVPVRRDVAMTGEITLRGRVLPIGGLKEKSLAAYRAGIYHVLIPQENEKDLEEIPKSVLESMTFIPVSGMDEVLKNALVVEVGGKLENDRPFLPLKPEIDDRPEARQ